MDGSQVDKSKEIAEPPQPAAEGGTPEQDDALTFSDWEKVVVPPHDHPAAESGDAQHDVTWEEWEEITLPTQPAAEGGAAQHDAALAALKENAEPSEPAAEGGAAQHDAALAALKENAEPSEPAVEGGAAQHDAAVEGGAAQHDTTLSLSDSKENAEPPQPAAEGGAAQHHAAAESGAAQHHAAAEGGAAQHHAAAESGAAQHHAAAEGWAAQHHAAAERGAAQHHAAAEGGAAQHHAAAEGWAAQHHAAAEAGAAQQDAVEEELWEDWEGTAEPPHHFPIRPVGGPGRSGHIYLPHSSLLPSSVYELDDARQEGLRDMFVQHVTKYEGAAIAPNEEFEIQWATMEFDLEECIKSGLVPEDTSASSGLDRDSYFHLKQCAEELQSNLFEGKLRESLGNLRGFRQLFSESRDPVLRHAFRGRPTEVLQNIYFGGDGILPEDRMLKEDPFHFTEIAKKIQGDDLLDDWLEPS